MRHEHTTFWFAHMFKGVKWHISLFEKNFNIDFLGHHQSKVFQTLHDYNLAWGLHFHCRLMTLTLFQGHRFVRNTNCKLCVLDSWRLVIYSLNVVWSPHMIKRFCTVWFVHLVYIQGRWIACFSSVKFLDLLKKFNIAIYSNTINVINVKLCMMVLLLALYLFIPLSVTLTIFQGHSNIEQF